MRGNAVQLTKNESDILSYIADTDDFAKRNITKSRKSGLGEYSENF